MWKPEHARERLPFPERRILGATWDGRGVNFALFSEHAKVDLCLFDSPEATAESRRVPLAEQTDMARRWSPRHASFLTSNVGTEADLQIREGA